MNNIEDGNMSDDIKDIKQSGPGGIEGEPVMPSPLEPPQVEQIKTPEELEAEKVVMEKVQDINREGTAFHAAPYSRGDSGEKKERLLRSIFSAGLLGFCFSYDGAVRPYEEFRREDNKAKIWIGTARMTKRNILNFNIVGRSIRSISEIEGTGWFGSIRSVGFIFDLSEFSEDSPVLASEIDSPKSKFKFKFRTFRAVWRGYMVGEWRRRFGDKKPGHPDIKKYLQKHKAQSWITDEGFPIPHPDDGFALTPRVKPRMLRGIVIGDLILEETPDVINVMKQCYEKKKQMMLPMYDQKGNLLWPRKMTYQEVKQFVAERDKKKAEEGKENG